MFIIIIDSPRDFTISPKKACYDIDDEILCTANAKPFPAYKWALEPSGQVLVNRRKLTITSELEGHVSVTCSAENVYGASNKTFSIFVSLKGCNLTTVTTGKNMI